MPGAHDLVASLAAKATPAELALLLANLPPALTSELRYSPRAAAVRDAFAALPGVQPTPAAKRIATELARYLATAWLFERDQGSRPTVDPLRAAIQRLARENKGKAIQWRQLLRIRKESRS